jgi:hypothetical protein
MAEEEKEEESEARADRMQAELDELDEHIDDAKKKAQRTREQSDLDDDEAGGELVGDFSDTASGDDDPSGAVDGAPQEER